MPRAPLPKLPLLGLLLTTAPLLATCASTKTALPAPPTPKPRGLLLLLADDLGHGELSSRDHPHIQTPHLDAMAADGLTLERFYAAAPVCSPTRASVLTGRHPVRTTTFAWGHDLPGAETTLPELLSARGLRTAHFGKWHLGSVRAGHPTSPGAQGYDTWAATPNFFDLDPPLSVNGVVTDHQGEGSDVLTERAIAFLEGAAAADAPFLITVWYGSPHDPHQAREADLAPFANAPEGSRSYCAEIAALDRSVGRLRKALSDLGLADDTLVWFTSDNGPRPPKSLDLAGSTGGLRGAKGTLWEGGLRVPSFVVWPAAIKPGSTSDVPCGTVDLLPTLVEATGATPSPAPLDGTSILPLLKGKPDALQDRALGFWSPPVKGRAQWPARILGAMRKGEVHPSETPPVVDPAFLEAPLLPGHAAWIRGRFKLHHIPAKNDLRVELYNLAIDPAETNDLSESLPTLTRTLLDELETWQREMGREARAALTGCAAIADCAAKPVR